MEIENKAQDTRILQPNELKIRMLVWIDRYNWIDFTKPREIVNIYECDPWVKSWPSPLNKHYKIVFDDYSSEHINEYWHEWRAWTSKPTEEQRKAAKWECSALEYFKSEARKKNMNLP